MFSVLLEEIMPRQVKLFTKTSHGLDPIQALIYYNLVLTTLIGYFFVRINDTAYHKYSINLRYKIGARRSEKCLFNLLLLVPSGDLWKDVTGPRNQEEEAKIFNLENGYYFEFDNGQ